MKYFEKEKLEIIRSKISDIKNPNILELGVQKGNSTKMFLDICNKNDGYLTSIDIKDCSNVSKDKRWKFIFSSDDNFEYINQHITDKKFDILFIDSYHEPSHVRKIFYHYFYYLKKNALIFIDDVMWLPYVKNGVRDNDFIERINRLTFNKLLEIFNNNIENLTLDINFNGSGLAMLKKTGDKLNKEIEIKNRLFTIKNLIKKFIYSPKPKN
ncbi:class I SAM-dependent methyltransferase [Candidatus Pelagibacter sp.]|uniref:class I SAM-dependent methyltransferase n=1 Tax=Candidatus Pelagibacter sp. TaxID=2024849 RepID=UPI003F85A6E3